jgi:hypothetical protein
MNVKMLALVAAVSLAPVARAQNADLNAAAGSLDKAGADAAAQVKEQGKAASAAVSTKAHAVKASATEKTVGAKTKTAGLVGQAKSKAKVAGKQGVGKATAKAGKLGAPTSVTDPAKAKGETGVEKTVDAAAVKLGDQAQ